MKGNLMGPGPLFCSGVLGLQEGWFAWVYRQYSLSNSTPESASQRWSTSNGRVWHGVLPALLPWSVSPLTPFATPLVSPVPGHTTIAGLGVAVCLQRGSRDGGRGGGGASVSPMLSCLAPPRRRSRRCMCRLRAGEGHGGLTISHSMDA